MEAEAAGTALKESETPLNWRGFYFEFTGIYRESALLPETESG
jgi:hypothetical protein